MIGVAADSGRAGICSLVVAALQRSVGIPLAQPSALSDAQDIALLIDPPDEWHASLARWLASRPRKLLIFGRLTRGFQEIAGARAVTPTDPGKAACLPASRGRPAQSQAVVRYGARASQLAGSAWERPLRRYDFADEWNNLGYGAVGVGSGDWDCRGSVKLDDVHELAVLEPSGASYAGLVDRAGWSMLWVDRPAGFIDSFEWRLVENFLSRHRAGELPTVPVLSEIPFGHDAAVTMRLDCDESIQSARPLIEAYRGWDVPPSVAILTRELADTDRTMLAEVVQAGGSVLSHSATHADQWGGSYEAALFEAAASGQRLESVSGERPRYAVSPFHASPDYALRALQQAGYAGCIGGRITDAPAFNLARGGRVHGLPPTFVGHSQQCMLHGDCLVDGPDPLATYKRAFDAAYETRTLFGYLDHPFSPRYQYGWSSESERVAMHGELIGYIRRRAEQPMFLGEDAAMDFLGRRQRTDIRRDGTGWIVAAMEQPPGAPEVAVEHRGETIRLSGGLRFQ